MKFLLNTARTIWQGEAIEAGKNLEMYRKAAAVCYLNREDMEKLGVKEGDVIRVKSKYGDVVVYAREASEPMTEGMVFMPLGPWANLVVSPETDSTGMPSFKGVPVEIEKAEGEEVLSMVELMRKKYLERD